MPPRTAAGAGENPAAPRADDAPREDWLRRVLKYVAVWWLVSTGSSFLLGPKSPLAGLINKNAPGPSSGGDPSKEVKTSQASGPQATPIWPEGASLTLSVYLSTSRWDHEANPELPRYVFEPVKYGDWNWQQTWETEFDVPPVIHPPSRCFHSRKLGLNKLMIYSPCNTMARSMLLPTSLQTAPSRDPQ